MASSVASCAPVSCACEELGGEQEEACAASPAFPHGTAGEVLEDTVDIAPSGPQGPQGVSAFPPALASVEEAARFHAPSWKPAGFMLGPGS